MNSFSLRNFIVFRIAIVGSGFPLAVKQAFRKVQVAYRSICSGVEATPAAMISSKALFIPGMSSSPLVAEKRGNRKDILKVEF